MLHLFKGRHERNNTSACARSKASNGKKQTVGPEDIFVEIRTFAFLRVPDINFHTSVPGAEQGAINHK